MPSKKNAIYQRALALRKTYEIYILDLLDLDQLGFTKQHLHTRPFRHLPYNQKMIFAIIMNLY